MPRTWTTAIACCLLGGTAIAQDRVVGGQPAAEGDWPDAVALFSNGGSFVCSGVLVAPDLVLTAAHCDFALHHAVLDTVDFEVGGEEIEVASTISHPDAWHTYDVALVTLAEDSAVTPRQVVGGCAVDAYLEAGASTSIVGFGAINPFGNEWTTRLMEARAPVVDPACTDLDEGCNELVSPGGELIAGGNGVDSCNGDSGGPLYLDTPSGPMLVGLTSRGTDDASVPCGDGGIYVRVDAILGWIEGETGRSLPRPVCPWYPNGNPDPWAEPLLLDQGTWGHTQVHPGDPDSRDVHWFAITSPPAHGMAEVTGNGVVRYTPNRRFSGSDSLEVEVRDSGMPPATARVDILIEVIPVDTRLVLRHGPCDSGGSPAGWLFLLPLVLSWRRR